MATVDNNMRNLRCCIIKHTDSVVWPHFGVFEVFSVFARTDKM
jgi:hypothetical protein